MSLILTCIKIFFARILDVSISTIRTTYVIRGRTLIVALLAFFEITIWFLVARTALNIELNTFIVLSYSGGYTMGTIIGTIITNKYIKTNLEVIIVSNKIKNIDFIKKRNYGVSILNKDNKKIVILIETNKSRIKELRNIIISKDKDAFITIKETKTVVNGYI